MIMVYKCVEWIEKIDVNEYVIPSQSSFRGHSKKLYKKKLKKNVKKYSFPDRAIDKWTRYRKKLYVLKVFIALKKSMMIWCQKTGHNELDSILWKYNKVRIR